MNLQPSDLAATRFAIVGCGGLGCPVVMNLLAAGAQRFVLIDDDQVEGHNLHRQVVYTLADRGRDKVEVMRDWIVARVPHASVEVHRLRLSSEAPAIWPFLRDKDLLLECTDQPEIKFRVGDYAVQHQHRAVIGGAQGWSGHVFAYVPGQACLRCVFEAPPPAEVQQSCALFGVLTSTTATVGAFMAAAALEIASNLATSSFVFNCDVRSLTPRRLILKPRQDCECAVARAAAPLDASTSSALFSTEIQSCTGLSGLTN